MLNISRASHACHPAIRILIGGALAAGTLVMFVPAAAAQQLIPRPVIMVQRPGQFTVTSDTVIWTAPSSAVLGHQLARYLEPATGFTFRVLTDGTAPAHSIS